MSVLVFILATFGIVEIIITGKPTGPLRSLFQKTKTGKEFIQCPLCLGFWIGIALSVLIPLLNMWYWNMFIGGCVGAGSSYLLHQYVHPIDLFGEEEK